MAAAEEAPRGLLECAPRSGLPRLDAPRPRPSCRPLLTQSGRRPGPARIRSTSRSRRGTRSQAFVKALGRSSSPRPRRLFLSTLKPSRVCRWWCRRRDGRSLYLPNARRTRRAYAAPRPRTQASPRTPDSTARAADAPPVLDRPAEAEAAGRHYHARALGARPLGPPLSKGREALRLL